MISKELLEAVLDKEIQYIRTLNSNEIEYTSGVWRNINIDELAQKCREWAWNNGYVSNSIMFFDFESNKTYSCAVAIANILDWEKFEADSGPEAVFEACEWILKKEG